MKSPRKSPPEWAVLSHYQAAFVSMQEDEIAKRQPQCLDSVLPGYICNCLLLSLLQHPASQLQANIDQRSMNNGTTN